MCYSWWVLSSLCMLEREQWIDAHTLRQFILDCQDMEHGGVSDKPGTLPHTSHYLT